MSDWRNIRSLWQHLQEAGERALLFSIVDVQGSSYRKLGAHMLVGKGGRQAGSVSAGCLESDLLTQIDDFFAGTLPRVVSYDNRGDDVFALNAGCSGAICILVEDAFADERNPIYAFAAVEQSRSSAVVATIIDGAATLVGTRLSVDETLRLVAHHELRQSTAIDTVIGGNTVRLSMEFIQCPLKVVIFGAQQDGRIVARLATNSGMSVLLADWRAHLWEHTADQLCGVDTLRARGADLSAIATDNRTAAVLMSHNYDQDKAALASLLERQLPYLGVMGPRKRTMQMLEEIGESRLPRDIAGVHFPVGLDIGADSPEEIALSIVAEIVSAFSRTSARSLSQKQAPIHASVI